MYNAASIQGKF